MRHYADVFRPVIVQGQTTQNIQTFTQVYTAVPCFIQPADTQLQWFYEQRGTTITTQIYTTATEKTYLREDIFVDQNGRQFHLVADPKPALDGKLYFELHSEEYTEGAKKRLGTEYYS